ncbi:ribonuclease HIII [Candidatus Zixiibacteriota bacterium]
MIHPEILIGVDESGKGDFFGPLVITAFLAPEKDTNKLKSLGVRDGKTLSVNRTHEIARALKENFNYSTIVYFPEDYNNQYKIIKNLNKLLAEGHAEAISSLYNQHQADMAISDKFGKPEHLEKALFKRKCTIELKQIVKGETIIQVAAASIIARSEFIEQMDNLSEKYGFEIPRGASSIVDQAGIKFVDEQGLNSLNLVAKLHFKNYQRIIKPNLFA